MRNFHAAILTGCAVAMILSGCGSAEKQSRGLVYFPDMYESPAYKSQQVMEVVLDANGKPVVLPVMTDPTTVMPTGGSIHYVPMLQTPPPGTMSRHFVPYAIDPLDFAGAHDLVNPLLPTAAVLKEGQKRFHISCAPCHGNDGNALNGYVALKFSGIPSLSTPVVGVMSDGDIYHIITSGRGRMPNYRAQLLPEQRWAVIQYVHLLNRSWTANDTTQEAFKKAAEAYAKEPENADLRRDFNNAKRIFDQAQTDLGLIADGTADWKTFVPRPEPRPEYVKPAWPEN